MIRTLLFISVLIFPYLRSSAQDSQANILYIVDSIPVIEDPGPENEVTPADIADVTVVKSRDTLKLLGLDKFDGAVFVFTKEYRKRPADIKRIPSLKQMERKDGIWYFRDIPYSGKFIDYYYSGRKQGEGTFQNGKAEGLRTMYHQNGHTAFERYYTGGVENGLTKEYYDDGTLKQKGEFVNGKENGIWESYFPNGQVKQRATFKGGEREGETIVYYSTGKILAASVTKNGETTPDKRLEKVLEFMSKGHASNREEDYKTAIKNYSKAIELDSTYAEAYFSRGTVKLNNFLIEEAILDLDNALRLEPYLKEALSNRAFARIRKHQEAGSRKLSEKNGVVVMASKDNPSIPEKELAMICDDLKQAIFLGDKVKMIMDAYHKFCKPQNKE